MEDIAKNLFASFIWFVAVYLILHCIKRYRTRGQRRFWRPFLKGDGPLAVVLTDKEGTKARSPRKVSLTDVQAFSDVRNTLASLGRDVEIKRGSSADIREMEGGSFVSLGGPKANGVTEKVISKLGPNFPIRYNAATECFEFAGSIFRADYDDHEFVTRDYGLVVRLLRLDGASPTSKPALIAFGLHGHGTEQTIKAVLNNSDLAKSLGPFSDGDSYAFLSFEFSDHMITKSDVIKVGSIIRG